MRWMILGVVVDVLFVQEGHKCLSVVITEDEHLGQVKVSRVIASTSNLSLFIDLTAFSSVEGMFLSNSFVNNIADVFVIHSRPAVQSGEATTHERKHCDWPKQMLDTCVKVVCF